MLPGWQSRSTQGTGHLQAPRPQHWCPDTCSCISYSRRQDTSGKKMLLQRWAWPGLPSTTRKAPVPRRNELWFIYTRVPHLFCPPRGLLQSLGRLFPPEQEPGYSNKVTSHPTLSQSKQARPHAGHHGAGRDCTGGGKKLLRHYSSKFLPPTPSFYPRPQKKKELINKKKGFHQD